MTQLQTLQLGGNMLTGPIPAFSAESLRAIDVSRNMLTGAPALSKLMGATGITEIDFFGNKLTGPISGLTGHGTMVVFDVHDNQMTGTIPDNYAVSMRNLFVLHAQKNKLYGFLSDMFRNSTIASFDFSDNQLYCPLPDPLPTGGKATCNYWKLTLANPSRCTVGQTCYVVVMGSGFVVGEQAMCKFGDVTSVPATVVSSSELRCIVTPSSPATVPLTITVQNKMVTSNSLLFEFSSSNDVKPARRSLPGNADPVHVRIHGEAKCPDFGSIVTIFDKIMHTLGTDVVDLQLGFIMKDIPEYSTGYWSLHGQSEVIGNALILCAEKQTNITAAVDFAACLAEKIDTVPNNAAQCAKQFGIDYDDIRTCAFSSTGQELLKKAQMLADKDDAVWSPTVIINDELYCLWHSTPCKATTEDDFLRAICDAYTGPKPAGCN